MADDGSPSVDDTGLTEKAMNESLWVSPSAEATVNRDTTKPGNGQTLFEKEAARETSLRAELATVRKVNEAIEGMVESLKKAQANMKVLSLNPVLDSSGKLIVEIQDGQFDGFICLEPAQHLDQDTFPDRT